MEALTDTIEAWQEREPETRVLFAHRGHLTDLGERINITLFRATQECLTNVASHAAASLVRIDLTGPGPSDDEHSQASQGECVTLVVGDNGRAWDPSSHRRGFGLIGMRERVEALSGRLELAAEPGKGVTVTVSIPVGNELPQ